MNVLIACEESGTVRDAFSKKGHYALSVDLLDSRTPGNHCKCDIRKILDQGHKWDLMIAFPTCTYLCNSGAHWLHRQPGRWAKMIEAAKFFKMLLEQDIPKIAIENPVMHKYAVEIIGRRQDQTIQPYQFGHSESKRTCVWVKGLPLLKPTNILERPERGYWNNQTPPGQNKLGPSKDRAKIRSRTYQGIADAMAEQWGI